MFDQDPLSRHQTNPGSLPKEFRFWHVLTGVCHDKCASYCRTSERDRDVRRVGELYLDFTVILYPRGRYFDIVT